MRWQMAIVKRASIGRSEDYELFMRLHAAGLQGANVQEYLYLYREDRNSYHRRSFPYALREARTRGKGFAAASDCPRCLRCPMSSSRCSSP